MKKLVRNKIPEIAAGGRLVFREASHEETRLLLREKLLEEVGEYLADQSLEELADVLSVVWELAIVEHSMGLPGLTDLAQRKAAAKGGFSDRQVMEWQPAEVAVSAKQDSPEETR